MIAMMVTSVDRDHRLDLTRRKEPHRCANDCSIIVQRAHSVGKCVSAGLYLDRTGPSEADVKIAVVS